MRETPADTTRAVGLAFLLHAVLFALLLIGMSRTHGTTASAAEPAMTVGLIEPNALSTAMQMALNIPTTSSPEAQPVKQTTVPPEPLPEPPPEPPPELLPEQAQVEPPPVEQERISDPDIVAQERVAGDAPSAETSASAMEQEAVEQLFGDRKQRVLALRRASRSHQTITQIVYALGRNAMATAAHSGAANRLNPPMANNTREGALWPGDESALLEAKLRAWLVPSDMMEGQPCSTTVQQLPHGEVVEWQLDAPCPFDEIIKRSIEDATLRAHPLPKVEFDAVSR
jgi:colicin import membrane protein